MTTIRRGPGTLIAGEAFALVEYDPAPRTLARRWTTTRCRSSSGGWDSQACRLEIDANQGEGILQLAELQLFIDGRPARLPGRP